MAQCVVERAKQGLWQAFEKNLGNPISKKGYLGAAEENLVPSVRLKNIKSDLADGQGNELDEKFRAIHSSAALVANCFGLWKKCPAQFSFCGQEGFDALQFERKCPTGLSGTPPHLDVFLENKECVIGIESKLLEYFSPKQGEFSNSYTRASLPQAEDSWWKAKEWVEQQGEMHLDAAQLIKHYLGLANLDSVGDKQLYLVYLFWEPENARQFPVCQQNRKEIRAFSRRSLDSSVTFITLSYLQLWNRWARKNIRPQHRRAVEKRYRIVI